jgi:hypothetical protein
LVFLLKFLFFFVFLPPQNLYHGLGGVAVLVVAEVVVAEAVAGAVAGAVAVLVAAEEVVG